MPIFKNKSRNGIAMHKLFLIPGIVLCVFLTEKPKTTCGIVKTVSEKRKTDSFYREDSAIEYNMHSGYFQDLVGFMGFENALCAMYEEPEEVEALMNYICDWYTTVEANVIDILKPDVIGLADDISTWRSPFMSEPMYRELFYPSHDREAKFARDRGLPITMHCCGEAM